MDRETVRVLSRRAPTLVWHCPKCHESSVFECTEQFRANAKGKLIDVWVIYRCRRCDNTRNLTVIERTPVKRLPSGLLAAAERNDPALARRFARDMALVRRNGAMVAEGDECECSGPPRPILGRDVEIELALEFPEPLIVRLDSLLAVVLAVSRSQLRRFLDARVVDVQAPGSKGTFRIWRGATVTIGSKLPPSPWR